MWVTPNDPSVDKFDARVHGSRTSGFGNFSSIQLDRRRRLANKATCLGVRTFAKGGTTSTFHIYRYGIASKHLKCPISKSNSLFFSNNPYSEPDADNSPNNDTDWDWGGGKASPCGSPGPNLDPDHQNPALTKTVLTGDDNTISKWLNVFCISCQFDLPAAFYLQSTQSYLT